MKSPATWLDLAEIKLAHARQIYENEDGDRPNPEGVSWLGSCHPFGVFVPSA